MYGNGRESILLEYKDIAMRIRVDESKSTVGFMYGGSKMDSGLKPPSLSSFGLVLSDGFGEGMSVTLPLDGK